MKHEPNSLNTWTETLRDEEMPIFSNTARKIQTVLTNDKKGAMDLASVIMQDPNLTAKLLKMSNSLSYNPSNQKVVTVSRAIVLLGSFVIRDLTLACSFFDAILSKKNKDKANEEIANAIHAAVQAKSLAILVNDKSPEEVFIATLLNNIGDIAFWCFSEQQGERIHALVHAGKSQPEAEREILGFNLSQLTTSLCHAWQLGGLIEEVIHHPHNKRAQLIELSHTITEASKQGWESDSMARCLFDISNISHHPIKTIKEILQKNTTLAVKIAQEFGAHDASKMIQHSQANKRETRHNVEHSLPIITDKKQLQFQILQDISNLLSDHINLNLLFETVMEGIHRGIGMDRSCFMLATPSHTSLNEKFSFGWDKTNNQQSLSFVLSANPENLFHYVVQSNQGLWAIPRQYKKYYTPHIINTIGHIECFLLPLYTNKTFVGLFYSDRAISHTPLTLEDFNSAKHFTQQAALGLNLYRINK